MEKKLSEMTDRELRDKGNKAIAESRKLMEDRAAGKEITPDREAQAVKWLDETDEIEKEINNRNLEAKMASLGTGPKIPGTDTESDEKFDPNFRPDQRKVNMTMRKFEQAEGKIKRFTEEERKIVRLMDIEEEAFLRFFRGGLKSDNCTEEDWAIIQGMNQRAAGIEKRVGAQSLTTTAGGYTVPQGFIPKVILYLKYISPFFDEQVTGPQTTGAIDIFDVYRTDSGNDLPVPTGDDTANVGELLGENSDASTATADLVFGQKTFKAYKYSSKMIKASSELLEDTGVDLVGYIAKQLGTRLGRILNTHFTTGDGSSKPSGIMTGISAGVVGASTGTPTFPEIIKLVHSVDPSYRKSPSARFMMHDNILKLLKLATVGTATYNNRPLWQPGWDVSAPPTIDGYQYMINQDMASTFAAGTKSMIFGDMKTFGVRWVNQLRLLRLAERYAELDQVAWVGFIRADSRLLNTSGIKYYSGT